jgi:hypothetical protein
VGHGLAAAVGAMDMELLVRLYLQLLWLYARRAQSCIWVVDALPLNAKTTCCKPLSMGMR